MGKLTTPLVIFLLLLSIASLVLGSMLFSQREILKGRTQVLENVAAEIAKNIRYDEFRVADIKEYEKMKAPLKRLAVAADNQRVDLQNTKEELARTEEDLEQTKATLAQTRSDLQQARSQIANLQEEMAIKERELASARGRIDSLENEKVALQVEIDDLNTRLVESEESMRDLQDELAALEAVIARMEGELGNQQRIPKGLTGRVILVNPYWNFVILDIGSEEGLSEQSEMLIHRGEELVGKVRVTNVKEQLAVAEVITDWEREPVQEGDYVLF